MLPRFFNDLNEFLKPYDLDMKSRIFEDSIPFLAKLGADKQKKDRAHLMKKLNNAGCQFVFPKLDEVNKDKLSQFCGMACNEASSASDESSDDVLFFEDKYEISAAHMEAIVIPVFKQFITTLNVMHPDFLNYYQVISKRIFERSALKKIQEYIALLLSEFNTNMNWMRKNLYLNRSWNEQIKL